jgi:hypothetical protein
MLTLELTHTQLGKTAGTWAVYACGNLAQSNIEIKPLGTSEAPDTRLKCRTSDLSISGNFLDMLNPSPFSWLASRRTY